MVCSIWAPARKSLGHHNPSRLLAPINYVHVLWGEERQYELHVSCPRTDHNDSPRVDLTLTFSPSYRPFIHSMPSVISIVQDAEDLSFKKGDILVVVEQNEEKWWTAVDEQGNKGLIPEPYVKKVCIAAARSDSTLPRFGLKIYY